MTVLTAAVSDGVPCSTEEKTALQSSTSSKVTASKAAASTYAAAKATQIATLHAEVQAQQDLITAANNALVSSGQTTIAAATIAYTQAQQQQEGQQQQVDSPNKNKQPNPGS